MKEFIKHYIACALWSSCENDGEPLDSNYGPDDIAPETLESIKWDCQSFVDKAKDLIKDNMTQAAHDFWLTRNHHGAGFWDGDWAKEDGEKLTKIAHEFGGIELYVGDDGKIYC